MSAIRPGPDFVEGLAILAVLWFAWSCYAWLGQHANTDDGLVRVILLAAMAAMLIASLAVPHAFGADGLLFGIAYFVVRLLHIVCYTTLARDLHDASSARRWRGSPRRCCQPPLCWCSRAHSRGRPARVCWAIALSIDYGGIVLRGVEGWRVEPGHFAERHSAVIIIALGESVVTLGVGAHGGSLSGRDRRRAARDGHDLRPVVGVLRHGLDRCRAALFEARPRTQVLMARDSYTVPAPVMVGGIVVFAIGVERTLPDIAAHLRGGRRGHTVRWARALSRRAERVQATEPRHVQPTPSGRRRILVALIPVATHIPALAALGMVTLVACGLIAFEFVRYSEARERIRHGTQPS